MKRRALLIGSPGVPGTKTYLQDMTKIDLNKIKNYLMSNNGGKWYENEILLLDTNKIIDVKKYINHVKNEYNDFVFCAFSGHGWYDGNKDSRVFEIGGSNLYESEFRQLSKKQLSIYDSCAEVYTLEILTENRIMAGMESMDSIDDKDYREIYNNEIIKCHQQEINLYSSSKNEFSQTDEDLGGHFIHYLLKVGASNQTKNLDAIDAFQITKEQMKNDKRSQNPSSSYPKSARNFLPFSLGRYA